MKRVTLILSLLSLNAVLTIIERLSFTTDIILQPYNFLRLHEIIQITIFLPVSVIGTFLILKYISNDFDTIKDTRGTVYVLLFVVGSYFYGLGEGLHEVASFFFNTYCDTKHIVTDACGSMFFNDYYTGNIYFFAGLLMSTVGILLLEQRGTYKKLSQRDLAIVLANSMIFAFTLIAYAALDRVLVGFIFLVIATLATGIIIVLRKKPIRKLPFTIYTFVAYAASMIITAIIRFH